MATGATFKFKNGKKRFTILDKITEASNTTQNVAKVGFPKGLVGVYPNGMSVIEVAIINEFGATIQHPGGTAYGFNSEKDFKSNKVKFLEKGKGFASLGKTDAHTIVIPPRPFMHYTAISSKAYVHNYQKNMARKLIKYGGNTDTMLSALAGKYVTFIQATIKNFQTPANAPSTIRAKKGTNNPLIDHGIMLQSVTYAIVPK